MTLAIQILLGIGIILFLVGIIKSAVKFTIIVAIVLVAAILISKKLGYLGDIPLALMLQGVQLL